MFTWSSSNYEIYHCNSMRYKNAYAKITKTNVSNLLLPASGLFVNPDSTGNKDNEKKQSAQTVN